MKHQEASTFCNGVQKTFTTKRSLSQKDSTKKISMCVCVGGGGGGEWCGWVCVRARMSKEINLQACYFLIYCPELICASAMEKVSLHLSKR